MSCFLLFFIVNSIKKKTRTKIQKKRLKSLIEVLKVSIEKNQLDEQIFNIIDVIVIGKMPIADKNLFPAVIVPVLKIFTFETPTTITNAYFMGKTTDTLACLYLKISLFP